MSDAAWFFAGVCVVTIAVWSAYIWTDWQNRINHYESGYEARKREEKYAGKEAK